MATVPTNNPIPSEDPRDLKFNAGKIDEVVNSDAHYYTDRFGVRRLTMSGFQFTAEEAIRKYGYIPMDSFEDGATLTLPNQVLRYEATGEYYRFDGELPKTVPSGSTPETAGGVGFGAWLSVGDAALRTELASVNGATLSLSQVATAYGLDFSLGSVWLPSEVSTVDNWWLHGNKIYKPYNNIELPAEPNLTDFYLLSADGSFSNTQFGMDLSATTSEKLAQIAAVLAANNATLEFKKSCTITLSTDFVWSFNYTIADGVTVTVNSDSATARNIRIERSNLTLHGLTLGVGVNVRVSTSSGILRNITIRGMTFTQGSINCVGSNRGYGLTVSGNKFHNDAGLVANAVQVSDWCDVTITRNVGGRFTNAFALFNPVYSYTCFNIDISNNVVQQCKTFGIVFDGEKEIGVINNFRITNNVISCPVTGTTRALVLNNAHGGVVEGNTLSGVIHTAADGCNDVKFVNNSSNFVGVVGLRCRGCAGWTIEGNTSHTNASSKYHVEFSTTTAVTNRGVAGRTHFNGNTYVGGSRGILLSSGIYYSVGQESFTSPTADASVGVVNVTATTFVSTIDGDQRSIKPTGNPVVTNSSPNSVVDGPAVHPTSTSTITAITSGVVVPELHGKVYHYTVDLNNNIENFQSTISPGNGKVVSEWAATVPGAKLAINASPFSITELGYRIQDSFVNGSPTPYTTLSPLTSINAGCVIHKNGTMQVRYKPNTQADSERFLEPQMGDYIWQSAFFSVPLIINGVVSNLGGDPTQAPRTAIGQSANGLLHVVVVDGRNTDSAGCTTEELANYMLSQGCVTAFNLDGGGSSTIWYNGSVINVPSDGTERVVAQAWVFK